MRWHRSGRGFGIALAMLVAFAAIAAPASAGKANKPKPTKTKIVDYRAGAGAPEETIYKSPLFKITAHCDDGERGPDVTLVNRVEDSNFYKFDVFETSFNSDFRSEWPEGNAHTNSYPGATGEVAVFDREGKRLYLIDEMFQGNEPGRARGVNEACTYTAAVTKVGEKDLISARSKTDAPVKVGKYIDYELSCSDDPTLTGSSLEEPALSLNHIDTELGFELEQRFFLPLESEETLFGPGPDIGDVVVARNVTTYTARLILVPRRTPNGKCMALGFKRSPKASFLYARPSDSTREVFYSEKGLKLSADCANGQMRVFASTTSPGSLLHATVIGDGNPFHIERLGFSDTEDAPVFLLDFPNISRNGQIGYVQPNGKAVFINYAGFNFGEQCAFFGASSTG